MMFAENGVPIDSLRFLLLLILVCSLSEIASAHNGPPFPIVTDQPTGPCKISIWAHPDIGTSNFFVLVDPLPGRSIPSDLKMEMGIQPVNGRLPEVVYPMTRDTGPGQIQYNVQVEFDRQEFFKVRVLVHSSEGEGEALSQVEATPAGFGRWDLLFYMTPFLVVVILFYRGVRKKRKQLAAQLQTENAQST